MWFVKDLNTGEEISRHDFELQAEALSIRLHDCGYHEYSRLGILDHWNIDNLIKYVAIQKVCSPVVIDHKLTETERSWYDVDIWTDIIPQARSYGMCEADEWLGLCSSGTTDKPRIIPWTEDIYNDQFTQYQILLELGDNERTISNMAFWSCFGQEIFNITREIDGQFVICNGSDWNLANPTWLAGSPAILWRMAQHKGHSRVHHIRTNAAPMPEHWFREIKETFGAHIVHCYGTNETGTATSMYDEWRPGSSGVPNPGKAVMIDNDEIIINGFRTGDIGHFDEDGYLYITGRKKEIFAFPDGRKIMPWEIEQPALEAGADDACAYWDGDKLWCFYEGRMSRKPDSSRPVMYHNTTIIRKAGKLQRKETYNNAKTGS